MGSIELDPASCELANKTVQAQRFYTKQNDGLNQEWKASTLWLNPPYLKGGQAIWSKKLIQEFESGNVEQAILLVNAVPDTSWFQPLWNYSLCFTSHRIKFISPEGIGNSPTHGSVFVYFGSNADKFYHIFSQFGKVIPQLRKVS